MPKMGGLELADRLLPLRPSMRVLFMSGYAPDELLDHGFAIDDAPLLAKPFPPEELACRVRDLLDADTGRHLI